MLIYPNGSLFTTSQVSFLDSIERVRGSKICIIVQFGESIKTMAIVDTGSPYCILNKEQIKTADPDYIELATERFKYEIRGDKLEGVLIRYPIRFIAETGDDLIIEGSVFVPDDEVPIPNFIGLEGCLSRMKFAVDSQSNTFFFGPAN